MAANDIGLNYATALIDSLKSAGEIRRAGRDLETFGAVLDEIPAAARLLDHPGLPLERRRRILEEMLAQIDPHPTSRRFLHLVLEKGRMRHIKDILASFGELRDTRLNMASAEVVTAVPIDRTVRVEWERALARLTGRSVRVAYRTDRALVGGALTRVGSVVYDGSVRRQLARIRGILLGE